MAHGQRRRHLDAHPGEFRLGLPAYGTETVECAISADKAIRQWPQHAEAIRAAVSYASPPLHAVVAIDDGQVNLCVRTGPRVEIAVPLRSHEALLLARQLLDSVLARMPAPIASCSRRRHRSGLHNIWVCTVMAGNVVMSAAADEIRQGEGRRTKLQINTTRAKAERGLDAYFTPSPPVWSLLALETVPHCIWEPAAGDGAIVRVLEAAGRRVIASDIADYGAGYPLADYLTAPAPPGVQGQSPTRRSASPRSGSRRPCARCRSWRCCCG